MSQDTIDMANVKSAACMLGGFTNHSFDPWDLMGPRNADKRQQIMSMLLYGGKKKHPKAKCGVSILRKTFWDIAQPQGNCIAVKSTWFQGWCFVHGYNMTEELYLDWVNNFATVERFAEYYNLEERIARGMINGYKLIHDC